MNSNPRESRYVRYARLAYQLCQMTVPLYRHPHSPHRFTQPQLMACVLLGFYLDLPYRDVEEWLLASDVVRQVLELQQVPHYSTLCRTFQRTRLPQLEALHKQLLTQLGVEEEARQRLSRHPRQPALSQPQRTTDARLRAGLLQCRD